MVDLADLEATLQHHPALRASQSFLCVRRRDRLSLLEAV